MHRHDVPTAKYRVCDSASRAAEVLRRGEFGFPVVLKADGLAAGKGVVIAERLDEALTHVQRMMVDKRFGEAGDRIVIEECLIGREASFFVISDGTRSVPVGSAEDHKRVFNGDQGPNTGGMGAYWPSAMMGPAMERRVLSEIVEPVIAGMREEGDEFRGFLFVGLMLTGAGPRVIEFNVRFGDPEAQVVLPGITDNLAPVLAAAALGRLDMNPLKRTAEPHVGVVLASGGYPDNYQTGKVIHGLEDAERLPDVTLFHSGTSKRGSELLTAGGRVMTVVARGRDYADAIERAYTAVDKISFEGMHFRRDIGAKALQP